MLFKKVALSVCTAALFATGSVGGSAKDADHVDHTRTCNVNIEECDAPDYAELVPTVGWNRQSCDSARSMKGWCRWWKYLRMKQAVVMNWMYGLKLRIYPSNEIFRALFVRGTYDPNNSLAIMKLLPKSGVFVDVGANMGYVSLLASTVVEAGGRVISVEPSSRDFERLVDNIKLNKLENIITPVKVAISDAEGAEKLSVANEERSALNTLGTAFGTKNIEKVATEDVEVISLDKLIERDELERLDVVKLDIEGSEYKALLGAKKVIQKFRPVIVLGTNGEALNACGSSTAELQQMLSELRYKVYKIVEEPEFKFEIVSDLTKVRTSIVYCFHESIMPPVLPQPAEMGCIEKVVHFITR